MKRLPSSVETEFELSYSWSLPVLKFLSIGIGKRLFKQVTYKYIRGKRLEIYLIDLLDQNKAIFSNVYFSTQFDLIHDSESLDKELEDFANKWRKKTLSILRFADFIVNRKTKESKIATPSRYKLLKLTVFLFSAKTQKEVFLQNMADWDFEIYENLEKDKDANLFMINVRNTYRFFLAMWQKSPIGDLIEFVVKIAKQ